MAPQNQGPVIRREVESMLGRTPSFAALDAETQRGLSDSMVKIAQALADDPTRYASQLAPPALQQRLSPGGQTTTPSPAPPPATPASGTTIGPAGGSSGSSGGSTGRVGEVARATLSAIDFPSFVASLIQGTFQAIVDSSIQQMQAYAELLKNVAMTVDQFMNDNVSDAAAKDYLADQHGGFLMRDTSGGSPQLRVVPQRSDSAPVPSFFKDLGFESPSDIDDAAMEQTIIPAARQQLAQQRQQTLATMVLLGINRVVVDTGEIEAKLMFHIDASDSMQMRFDQNKTTVGTMARSSGTSPFSAQALMVNTASINAQSDINVRADLTGRVNVKFRSETFPLERFADSAAIQLINSNAKVPAPAAAPAAPATAAAPAAPPPVPAPPPATAVKAPVAAAPATPKSQSLGVDPWAPEVSP